MKDNQQRWSARMTDTIMAQYPILYQKWAYEWGVVLRGVEQLYQQTGDQKYFDYIKSNINEFVQADGTIRSYRIDDYNLDQINTGKLLFGLRHITGDSRYTKALHLLRSQLETHPRTSENGFWHKQIYPYQMWLDGIYMAGPFYAEYGKTFDEPAAFDDVAHQIILIEGHTRDSKTGLLYHGWDESREQKWADPETGCSSHFWGRSIGWYMMAIPDILDHLPEDHPQRDQILDIFRQTTAALVRVQEPSSGLWYQVLDQGDRDGNYLEASASCMFVYGIAKGVRLGYLDAVMLDIARQAYAGVVSRLITVDDQNGVTLNQICAVAGLGGNPYRDGSYEYYVGEKIAANDLKGVGAFIQASVEMERVQDR